jgi:hypothetical protein
MQFNNKKENVESIDKVARLSIDLLASDHKRLKTVASLMGMTMKDLVVISVGDFMEHRLNEIANAPEKKQQEIKNPKSKNKNRR